MQGRRVFFLPALLLSAAMAWAQQPTVITSVDDLVRGRLRNDSFSRDVGIFGRMITLSG